MVTWKYRWPTGRYETSHNGFPLSIDDGEIYCESTDTKPVTRVANGAWLIEIDTQKVYCFNERSQQWVQWGGDTNGI